MTEAAKKVRIPNSISPKGILVYPKLHTPDTKFVADGVYTTRLRVSAEDAADLIAKIDAAGKVKFDEVKKALLADPKTKNKAKDLKLADKPYREAVDAEGNPTGDIEFNFKMQSQYKDKKSGAIKKLEPGLFDAKGNALPKSVSIWGGTEAKISFQLNPFFKTVQVGAGVGLRLAGVQVLKLVTKGAQSAAGLGFGAEEGYEAAAGGDDFGDESATPAAGGDGEPAGAPSGEEEF